MIINHFFLLLSLYISLPSAESVFPLYVYEAYNPHRVIIRLEDTVPEGWNFRTVFYGFNSEEIGSVIFTYSEAESPLRGMLNPGDSSPDGWQKIFTFWALPKETYCSCKITVSESGAGICDTLVGPPPEKIKGKLTKIEEDPIDCYTKSSDGCKCTFTRGAWATNFASGGSSNNYLCRWPELPYTDTPLDISWILAGEDSTEDSVLCYRTWFGILNAAVTGDYWLILSQQWVAAALNLMNGACWSCSGYTEECEFVIDRLRAVQDRLNTCEPVGETEWNNGLGADHQLFDDFNNGRIGPGHCGDPGIIDDKADGHGCCSNCERKNNLKPQNVADNYIQREDLNVNVPVLQNDPHRIVVNKESYVLEFGWCPRLSFYSPCPKWESAYWK